MIKIIKPGKTDFRMTCDKCGCVFEYNVVDIDDGYIKCPTCGKKHYGFGSDYELEKNTAEYSPTELTKPNQPSDYYTVPLRTTPGMPVDPLISQPMDCKDCPTYKQICSPTGYVGDLPCQWCSKNPWKITCDTTTYVTSVSNETMGARSWTTASATAFSEPEDMKITCKTDRVEYETSDARDYSCCGSNYESASYESSSYANSGTLDCCEQTYTYSQYAEPCSCTDGKEFYVCTAEGINYEFASDSLGAYEPSSFTIDLPKEEDTNK